MNWQTGIRKSLLTNVTDQAERDAIYQRLKVNSDNLRTGDFNQRRGIVKEITNDIINYGGEDKDRLLTAFAADISDQYGKAATDAGSFANDPKELTDHLDANQLAAWHYVEDVHPNEINKYKAALIPSDQIKDNGYAQLQKEIAAKELGKIGAGLARNYATEIVNDTAKEYQKLVDYSKVNNGLPPEMLQRAQEIEAQNQPYFDIIKKADNDDFVYNNKYFGASYLDANNFAKELLSQEEGAGKGFLSAAESVYWKGAEAAGNTVMGLANAVKMPFLSDQENEINLAEMLGKREKMENVAFQPQSSKGRNKEFEPIVKDSLRKEIKAIADDKTIDQKTKEDKVTRLLINRTDEWQRSPIGRESNITLKSLLYGVSNLAVELIPFLATEGLGSAAGLGHFTSSLVSAVSTGLQESITQKAKEGSANPYRDGFIVNAINAFALAGVGGAEAIKSMAGTKTVIGKLINDMSNAEIEAALRQEPKALSRFKKIYGVGKRIGQGGLESLKGAAKITAATTAGQAVGDLMYNQAKPIEDYTKQAAIETLKFGIFGTLTGGLQKGFAEDINDVAKSTLYEAAQDPSKYLSEVDKKLQLKTITPEEAKQVKDNINNAYKIYSKIGFYDAEGKPLDEKAKRDLLFWKLQAADVDNVLNQEIPEKLREDLKKRRLDIEEKISDVYNYPFGKPEKTTQKIKSYNVIVSGPIEKDDILKKVEGGFGKVLQVNENGSVVVEDINQPGKKTLWQKDEIFTRTPEEIAEIKKKEQPKAEEETTTTITPAETTEQEQAYEYNGKQYIVKGNSATTSEGDLVPIDLVDKIKTEGKLVESPAVAEKPVIESVDTEVVQKQMKPFTDKMVEIEREFKNNGYDIDWDYDNEIQVLDKDGEQVDPEDLPENLLDLASQYEQATKKLADFDQKSYIKALQDSRKVEETTAEEVTPEKKELPEANKAEIEKLRADEQAELDSKIPNAEQYRVDGKVDRDKLTNEEDRKAFDEIYDKYDKLITPLLEGKEAPKAKTSKELAKILEPTEAKLIKNVHGDKAYNYVNKDGVEVTLKEDEEGGYVNGQQVQADVHLDFIGNDTKRGEGLASKELDRIISEADKNNMSISLIVDSDQAVRGTTSKKGLDNAELKKWYESKGFIFDRDSRFGYRPKPTEDVSIYKRPEYIAKEGEVTKDNIEYHSSPEDLQEAFDQDRLKEGTFHEDGNGYIYKMEDGKLKEVKNVKYVPYENKKVVDKIVYSAVPKEKVETKEEEITPMEGEEPQPFVTGGKTIVTRTGLTEEGRQKLIEQRNRETKVTQRSKDEQAILDEIKSYNSLKEGRLGKLKPEGLAQLNKIRLKIADFNEKHKANYEFNQKRGVLLNDNNRSVKTKTVEGKENEIDESGKTLRERSQQTQEIFDNLLEQGAMPTGYRADGLRMSDVQLDATIQDILDGVPSRRANKYLNDLENQIANDDFDFSKSGDMPAYMRPEMKLDDVLGVSKEIVTEPMTEESLNNWLETESERTPENEEVYDNIDNLITEYETRNESEGEVQPTPTETEKGAAKPIEQVNEKKEPVGKVEPAKPTTKEGEVVNIKTPDGDKKATRIVIPGFEDIDFVVTKEGMVYEVRELASGVKVAQSNAFTLEGAISDVRDALMSKNITAEKLYKKIKSASQAGGDVLLRAKNKSEAYDSYISSEQEKESKKPYIHTEEERNALLDIAKTAEKEGLTSLKNIVESAANRKSGEKLSLEAAKERLETARENKKIEDLKSENKPLPKKDKVILSDTEEDFKKRINEEYTSDRYSSIPENIRNAAYEAYKKYIAIHNEYGYFPKSIKTSLGETPLDLSIALARYIKGANAREVATRTERIKEAEAKINEVIEKINGIYEKELGAEKKERNKPGPKPKEKEPVVLPESAKSKLEKFKKKEVVAEEAPVPSVEATKPTEAEKLTEEEKEKREIEIERAEDKEKVKLENDLEKLKDKIEQARYDIPKKEDVDAAIKEYQDLIEQKNNLEKEIENARVKRAVRKNLYMNDDIISETPKYKDLYKKDPRLASLQYEKDSLDTFKSDDYKDYLKERGESEESIKELVNRQIELTEEDIKDLETSLKNEPPKGEKPSDISFSFEVEKDENLKDMTDAVLDIIKDSPEKPLKEVQSDIAEFTGDSSQDMRKLVSEAYKEAKNIATEEIVKDPVLRRLNKAFLNIDTVILDNEKSLLEEADKLQDVKFHYDIKGEVLGFTHEGRIYLNGEKINAKTTMEEAGHIWVNNMKETNKELYQAGIDKVKGSSYLSNVMNSEFYQREALKQGAKGTKAYNDYMNEEALAKAIADEGAKFATETQKADFKRWVMNMWRNVIKAFGLQEMTPEEVAKLSLRDFARKAAADVFMKERRAEERKTAIEEVKQKEKETTEVPKDTTNRFLYEGTTQQKTRGFFKHLEEAENVSQSTKDAFKKAGTTKYKVANNEEARLVATDVIKAFGKDDALNMARRNDILHPSVRSAIYAELINSAFMKEATAKTTAEKLAAATEWKDLSKEYAEQLTAGGQFTAYAGHFYGQSPMGFVMRENEITEERFNEWMENKEEDYKSLYENLLASVNAGEFAKTPEEKKFQEATQNKSKDQIQAEAERLYKELPKEKKSAVDKALNMLDRLQDKIRRNTYSDFTGMTALVDAGITTIKAAIKAGVAVSKAIEMGIDEIRTAYEKATGKKWEKEDDFRTDMHEGFNAEPEKGTEAALKKRIADLKKQIEDLKDKIAKGGEAGKAKEKKFSDNPEVQKLIEERDRLKKENEELQKKAGIGKYSDESKIAAAKKAAQKNIEELERKLAENDLEIKKKTSPTDAELEAFKAKQKQLREEIEKRRKEQEVGKYSAQERAEQEAKRKQARIDELNRRINEKDFSAEEYKAKKEKTELDKELAEAQKKYDEAKKTSPEYIDKKARQFLDQFKDKLAGMSEEKKQELVRRYIKKLVESGGLTRPGYEEFKKMVADVMGFKDLTPDQITRVEDLTNIVNAVEGYERDMVENPNPTTIAAYEKARKEALLAGLELSNMVHKESDAIGTFRSFLTAGLLGLPTLIKNPAGNAIVQALARLPISTVVAGMEYPAYWASLLMNKLNGAKILNPSKSILLAQKGYFGKLKSGAEMAAFNFMKGTQIRDYLSTSSYQSNLSPKEALKNLKLYKQGEIYLTKPEVADNLIKATLGWQPNLILKAMGAGDTPFRWAAEGATALQIAAKELNLTDPNQIDAFMLSPEKMAYKIFRERNVPEENAAKRAAEIKERILYSGRRAVFEEDNYLSEFSGLVDSWLNRNPENKPQILKKAGSILKTFTLPFVKIPSNMAWFGVKLMSPELSMIWGIKQGVEAAKYAKKGDFANARKYYELSKYSLATAVVGYGVAAAAQYLFTNNLVRTSNDKDTKVREALGEKVYGKQNQINVGKLLGGQDFYIDMGWYGPLGFAVDNQVKNEQQHIEDALKGKTNKYNERLGNFFGKATESFTTGAADALNSTIFDQGSKTIKAISGDENDVKQFLVSSANTFGNVFTGATFTTISKAMLPYYPRLRGDGAMEEIKNNYTYRNALVRWAAGQPPARISIWGEPMKQDNSLKGIINNFLGFEEGDRTKFGAILFDDYEKSQDQRFFPPQEDNKLTVNGKEIEMPQSDKDKLEIEIGKVRKNFVNAFVYDSAVLPKVPEFERDEQGVLTSKTNEEKKYTEMTLEQKAEALSTIWEISKQIGYEEFKKKNPKYAEARLTSEEIKKKVYKEVDKKLFQIRLEQFNKALNNLNK